MHLCTHICHQGISQTSCCAGSREICISGSCKSSALRLKGKIPKPAVEKPHLLLCSSFLGSKHIGRSVLSEKGIPYVASHIYPKGGRAEVIPRLLKNLHHTATSVARGAASKTYHYPAASSRSSVKKHLSHTPGTGCHRIALFRFHKSETTGRSHLHIGRSIIAHKILRLAFPHQRVVHASAYALNVRKMM